MTTNGGPPKARRPITTRYAVDDGELQAVEVFERADGDWQQPGDGNRASYGGGRWRRPWLSATPKEAWERELENAKRQVTMAQESLAKAEARRDRATKALEAMPSAE